MKFYVFFNLRGGAQTRAGPTSSSRTRSPLWAAVRVNHPRPKWTTTMNLLIENEFSFQRGPIKASVKV